jgi:hypothetical protein
MKRAITDMTADAMADADAQKKIESDAAPAPPKAE